MSDHGDDSVVPLQAECFGCGYALRGLQEFRCPECGRAFNPVDVTTMKLPRGLTQKQIALLKRMGPENVLAYRFHCIFGIALSLCLLPRGPMLMLFVIPAITMILAYEWELATRQRLARRCGQDDDRQRFDVLPKKAWRKLFLIMFLVATRAPMYVMWWAHRPLMDRYTHRVENSPWNYTPPPQWVGLYRVYVGEKDLTSMRVILVGIGGGQAEFVFQEQDRPDGKLFMHRYARPEPLGGRWYTDF